MKTALITGSAGFIGRHLVPKLAVHYEVARVDPLHAVGCGMRYKIQDVPGLHPPWDGVVQFDVVVHLAANIENVDARMRGGISMYQDTVLDYAMAEYLEAHPPRECAVWMSSCAIDNPDDPYATIKLQGERLAATLHKQGVPIVVLRPYSGYGSDQSQEYPFPAILGRAMRREDPLTVWGSGKQQRDWLHVCDLVGAIMWAIEKAPRGVPIPIGTGVGTDFLTLAKMMAGAVGYNPVIQPMPDKAESSPRRVCDTTLAKEHGWTAKIGLEEGIRDAIGQITRA